MPENIETFDRVAAEILAKLHAAHPIGAEFSGPLVSTSSGPNAEVEEARFLHATLRFLEREGVLHVGREVGIDRAFLLRGVTLTARGFGVLGQPAPGVLAPGGAPQTVGERLTSALAAGSKEALKAAVGQVVAFGATVAMNYRPS